MTHHGTAKRDDASSRERHEQLNAAVVRITSMVMAVVAATMVLAIFVHGPTPGSTPEIRSARIAIGTLLCLVSLAAFLMARRGLTRSAATLFGSTMFVLIMAIPVALGLGVHSAGLPVLAALIMFVGFLISPGAALLTTALAVGAVLGLYGAEMAGILPGATPSTAPPAVILTGAYVLLYITVGGLTMRYARLFGSTIAKLEESRRDLETTLAAQRKGEAALHEAKEAAEAANLAKSRFLATMSHEIRTPMNGILGMAQLLQMRDLDESDRQEYARVIMDSGRTLLTLLNDILDLSKIEAGRIDLEALVFEPEQVLREVAALFAAGAAAKGLVLDTVWQGAPDVRYRADPLRLRQMLSNLVSNAIKFTARGTIRIEGREVQLLPDGALLEFSVADTGIGIPTDKHSLLFKPFSQVDASTTRRFGGTGLGLSIVRHLAQLMGGDVGVESEEGTGARVWFRIRVGRT